MTSAIAMSPSVGIAVQDIRTHGSTVIRDAWPLDRLARIREAIATFVARRAARAESEPSERMYVSHGVGAFSSIVQEGLATPQDLVDLFRDSHYHAICREYFQSDDLYCLPNRLGFRDHDPRTSSRSFIPYHQDSYTQDARIPHVLNCWIPLDPGAGTTAPGLEVVRAPCRADFPRKDFGLKSENAAYDFITIDRADIVKEYGENFLAPSFDLGDGLIFSQDVIHRTYVTPEMTDPRINFELRVFAANGVAPEHAATILPIALRVS